MGTTAQSQISGPSTVASLPLPLPLSTDRAEGGGAKPRNREGRGQGTTAKLRGHGKCPSTDWESCDL